MRDRGIIVVIIGGVASAGQLAAQAAKAALVRQIDPLVEIGCHLLDSHDKQLVNEMQDVLQSNDGIPDLPAPPPVNLVINQPISDPHDGAVVMKQRFRDPKVLPVTPKNIRPKHGYAGKTFVYRGAKSRESKNRWNG